MNKLKSDKTPSIERLENYLNDYENDDESKKIGRFEWRDASQHILFFFTYILNWNGLYMVSYSLIQEEPENEPNVVHYLTVLVFMVGPLMFLQVFLGQYTRRGGFCVGKMMPLGAGFGFLLIMLSTATLCIQLYFTSLILFYFFATFHYRTPPWMFCYDTFLKINPGCFSIRDIDLCPTKAVSSHPCFDPAFRTLSAHIFKDLIAFKRISVYDGEMEKYHSNFFIYCSHTIHAGIIYILLLIFSSKDIRNLDLTFKLTSFICLVASLSISAAVLTQVGAVNGIYMALEKLQLSKFFNFYPWVYAYRKIILALRISEGGQILFGSFMPSNSPSPHRTLRLTMVFYIYVLYITCFFHIFEGIMNYKLSMNAGGLYFTSEENMMFVMFPIILGSQASAQFFSLTFFLLVILLSFHSMVLRIIVIETTVSDHFDISDYSLYVRFVVCSMAFAFTYFLAQPHSKHFFHHLYTEIKIFSDLTNIIFLMIVFLYGTQRITDDMHFHLKVPVASYIKFCWIFTFIITIISINFFKIKISLHMEFYDVSETEGDSGVREIHYSPWHSILFCFPMICALIYQIYNHVKEKNLIAILKASDDFGPPDIDTRILRVLYNPRLSVRYRRQSEFCNHECLLNTKAEKVAIFEEYKLLEKFIEELKQSKTENNIHMIIVEQLEKDKKLLKKYIVNKF